MARCQKTEKENRQGYQERLIIKLIEFLGKLLRWEGCSVPGRVNLIVDIILFLLLVIYILSSSGVAMVRIVASIFNQSLTGQTGDNIVNLAVIFIVWALVCFLVAFHDLLEKKKIKEHFESDKIDEE